MKAYLESKYDYIKLSGTFTPGGFYFIESRVHGLFACFYCILYGLFICEMEHLKPIIVLDKNHLYYDELYGNNIFTYYYKVEDIGQEPLGTIHVLNPSKFLHFCRISTKEKYISNILIKKYFILEDNLKKTIRDFSRDYFLGSRILGVHYRGKDKIKETHLVPFSEYLIKIDFLLDNNICDKVFFVTDELHLRKYVSARYQNKVILYNLEADYSNIGPDKREGLHFSNLNSPYLHAKDALLECYLLSECHLFMSSNHSSMSLFATFINPRLAHIIIEP